MEQMEFDELMHQALKDEKEVPQKLNDKLMKKIKLKANYMKLLKSIPMSAAACLIAGIAITAILYNNQGIVEFPNDTAADNNVIVGSVISENEAIPEPVKEENKPVNKKVTKSVKKETVTKKAEKNILSEAETKTEEINQEFSAVNELKNDNEILSRAVVAKNEVLIDYLENDEVLLNSISESIKEKIELDDNIEYYADFSGVSGFEHFELTENNELVVIFEAGVVAPIENGEIYFNVGIVK